MAYGVSSDTSDVDVYGFCVPPAKIIFPHLTGQIQGFGDQAPIFNQWQQHGIKEERRPEYEVGQAVPVKYSKEKIYDVTVFNIVRYFDLLMGGNPNIVDSLFVPRRCVLYSSAIGELVRENRDLFLHKGCWHKFKGYAYSQLHKMKSQSREGKRKEIVEKYGYDIKFAYHVVRLLSEIKQILEEGTLDLERNREQLKSIRNGEWSMQKIVDHFERNEKRLESLYEKSTIPYAPDKKAIKELLIKCIKMSEGSVKIIEPDKYQVAVEKITNIIDNLNENKE